MNHHKIKSVAEIPGIDKDIVQLCDVLNTFDGFKTRHSCSGHEEGEEFNVWFLVDNSMDARDSLGLLSYIIRSFSVLVLGGAYVPDAIKCELDGEGLTGGGKLIFHFYGECDPNKLAKWMEETIEEEKKEIDFLL